MPYRLAMAILALTIIAGFSMGQGCMIAASRVTFAYARDDCFPYSNLWKKGTQPIPISEVRFLTHSVNKTTKTPVNAVIINGVIGVLLLLLIFGGSIAAGALFSIGAIAQYIAFTIPIFIRLFMVGNRFRPGPWNLGRLTLPIGSIACGFVALMTPIMCFPYYHGSDLTDPSDMNWTALVYGGPMLFVMIWWFLSAHKWFKGPKINLAHMLGREGEIEQIKGLDIIRSADQVSDSGSDGIGKNKTDVQVQSK